MNIDDLRKDYLKTKPKQQNWLAIENRLGSQNRNYKPVFHSILFFLAIMILSTSTIVESSQKSKPGEVLYGVKITSDNFYSKISGNYETSIEKRTRDILNSQNSPQQLNDATKQYQKTLEDSKQQANQKGEREQFNETLRRQEKEFEHARQNNPQNQQKLDEIIDSTQRIRGEVEGEKDLKQNNGEKQSEDSREKSD